MEIALYVLGILAFLVGIVGVIVPGIPGGIFLALGVVLAAWAESFTRITPLTVIVAVVLSLVITLVDYVATLLGAKLGGGTRWGILGSAVGLVVGFFLGPFGIIFGPMAGAIAFEYWKNPDARAALKAGAGVALGFLVGIIAKLALVFVLLGIVAFDWLQS